MRGAERVVFALGALGEAGKPAALAQRADAIAPPGQNLVRIGLMADIPDQPVARRVEDVVQRHGQLDDAEPGAQMPAGHRDGADRLRAQFVGEPRAGRRPAACAGRPAFERDRAAASSVASRSSLCRGVGPIRRRENATTTPETVRAAIASRASGSPRREAASGAGLRLCDRPSVASSFRRPVAPRAARAEHAIPEADADAEIGVVVIMMRHVPHARLVEPVARLDRRDDASRDGRTCSRRSRCSMPLVKPPAKIGSKPRSGR